MRRRSIVVAATGIALVSALGAPAAAGGWWSSIRIDGPHLGAGETLVVRAVPTFESIASAEAARSSGDYYAYLLQGVDPRMLSRAMRVAEPGDWWSPPPVALRSGPVRFRRLNANLARVSARVTVPEVAPGRYTLMLCSAGCERPLGTVIPADVVVSSDPALASLSRRLNAARWRLREKAAKAWNRLGAARKRAAELREQLDDALREPAQEPRAGDLPAAGSPGGGFGSGVAAGGAAGLTAGIALGGAAARAHRKRRGIRFRDASAAHVAERR